MSRDTVHPVNVIIHEVAMMNECAFDNFAPDPRTKCFTRETGSQHVLVFQRS